MNKDQVNGGAQNIAGKVQEKAGKLAGSKEQRAREAFKTGFGKDAKGSR
jgi:uncharacterized protein YjbJ (UPF0337 family)